MYFVRGKGLIFEQHNRLQTVADMSVDRVMLVMFIDKINNMRVTSMIDL